MAQDITYNENTKQFELNTLSDEIHLIDLVLARKGDYKINPDLGVDLDNKLQTNISLLELSNIVIEEFRKDTIGIVGLQDPIVTTNERGKLTVAGSYG